MAESGKTISTQAVVEGFLSTFKKIPFNRICPMPRQDRDFLNDLADLELNQETAKSILRTLAVENYVSGPDVDNHCRDRDLWIFGYKQGGQDVYLKFGYMAIPNQEPRGIIWSFHLSSYPLVYPYGRAKHEK